MVVVAAVAVTLLEAAAATAVVIAAELERGIVDHCLNVLIALNGIRVRPTNH